MFCSIVTGIGLEFNIFTIDTRILRANNVIGGAVSQYLVERQGAPLGKGLQLKCTPMAVRGTSEIVFGAP